MKMHDYALTKEQKLIQKAFRDFAETVIAPQVDLIERECRIPDEIVDGLAEMDAFGMPIPVEYGGAGAGWDGYALMIEEIARVCTGVAMMIVPHTGLLAMVYVNGTEEQKREWLPLGCSGKEIWRGGFTEPQTGSDPKQLAGTAKAEGDYFILNGTKRFITNAKMRNPRHFYILKQPDTQDIGMFVIPEDCCEGVTVSAEWEKIGQHGGPLADVYLKDVKIPKEYRLGGNEGRNGYTVLTKGVAYGKVGLSANALGSAAAAYDEAYKYATTKMHRDEPITKFQAVRMRLADVYMKYKTAQEMTYRFAGIANMVMAGELPEFELAKNGALTRLYVCDQAFDCARSSQILHSAYGTVNDYAITRILRDASMGHGLEGQEDMQKVIIASYLLGKD